MSLEEVNQYTEEIEKLYNLLKKDKSEINIILSKINYFYSKLDDIMYGIDTRFNEEKKKLFDLRHLIMNEIN